MALDEPLSQADAKKLVRKIVSSGVVGYSKHALGEMKKDGFGELEATAVLRAGLIKMPAEFEHGEWRYRVETRNFAVVVAFESETVLVVVTAWRY